jgi:hypothetical protein
MEDKVRGEVWGLASGGEAGEASAARSSTETLDQCAVRLNAEGIHSEGDRLPAVIESREQERDRVLRGELVSLGQACAHAACGRFSANTEVDGARGVENEDLGLLFGRPPVGRRVLRERGEPGRPAPGRVVEHAIDLDALVEPRRRDFQLIVAALVGRAGRGFRRSDGGEQEQ